jgi:hypothetical protein
LNAFGPHSGPLKILVFRLSQEFTASSWPNINLLEHFIMALNKTLLAFGVFGKSCSNQILVEQGKVKFLLENCTIFQKEYALEF